jgi:BspA type Leucine rich repeat region (6 copies)
VTSIGDGAFNDCTGLTSVMIPNSVTKFGVTPFGSCTSLTNITVDALNSSYSSLNGVVFNKRQTTLIEYPAGKAGAYMIPNSVTQIGDWAFLGCQNLTSVTIPDSVTSIGVQAFAYCYSLTSVTIPSSVTIIGDNAFIDCIWMNGVYFKGNAPQLGYVVFDDDNNATVYYLSGTSGWDTTFADRPTALWLPQVQTSVASFGVHTNHFGFTITWASDKVVVVEAATDLTNPTWSPVGTNTLTTGSAYFADPQWTKYPSRFYRIRSP